ncbi:MAG TPA: hypothetical protein VFX15_00070 [Actinomycetes bacterium]|nr:hypothetical protein [Actinomycetes bacterium]
MTRCEGSLLLTGPYGVGKSTAIAEMGNAFEEAGIPFGAIDLDWLSWFDAGWNDERRSFGVLLKNLDAVVTNYLDAGVRYVVMALTVEHSWELDGIRSVAPEPLHVVRLEADIETIRDRLAPDPTSGRAIDLASAEKAVASGAGADLADHVIRGEGPVRVLVHEVLNTIGWTLDR